MSDDFGYGDAGAFLGGETGGMPTPNIDRLAAEGMMFLSFYARPGCTPEFAAMQTARIPNRSGMTTVAFRALITTRPYSICAATMASKPADWRSIQICAGKARKSYVATVPQVLDLWQDP